MNSSPAYPSPSSPLTQNENPALRSHSGVPRMLLVKNVLRASFAKSNRTAPPVFPSTNRAVPSDAGGRNSRLSMLEMLRTSSARTRVGDIESASARTILRVGIVVDLGRNGRLSGPDRD